MCPVPVLHPDLQRLRLPKLTHVQRTCGLTDCVEGLPQGGVLQNGSTCSMLQRVSPNVPQQQLPCGGLWLQCCLRCSHVAGHACPSQALCCVWKHLISEASA